MPISRYLDRFLSKIPKVQARQIFGMLQDLKDSGAIKTVREYNQKLQVLSEHLKSTDPQPMFKFFEGVIGEVVDSDRFNTMVKATTQDLETAFGEIENVADVLELHKNLYKMNILKSLRKATTKLNDQITLYEFFAHDNHGFTKAQYNTFAESDGNALPRNDLAALALYRDPVLNTPLGAEYDMVVDLTGERLTVPFRSVEEIKVVDIGLIEDADTTFSTRDVRFSASNDIRNIIDQKKFTYWICPVLTDNVQSSGAKIKLKFDFGGIREFNYIQLQPASPKPMVITAIEYIGEDGSTESVSMGNGFTVSQDIGAGLVAVSARYVTITLRQDNYEMLSYHHEPDKDLWQRIWEEDLDRDTSDSERIQRLAEELSEEISETNLQDILDIDPTRNFEPVSAYQYTFGLDNVRFFNKKCQEKGIFVSQKLEVEGGAGLVGLVTNQDDAVVSLSGDEYYAYTFEYYLTKRDFDANGGLIDQKVVPLPHLENGTVREHLVLSIREGSSVYNTGTFRFAPVVVGATTPVVYKNLTTELFIDIDYLVKVDGADTWRTTWAAVEDDIFDYSATVTPPLKVYINITNPSAYDTYMVHYQIQTRNDTNSAMHRKLSDHITLTDSLALRCSSSKRIPVAKSDLYLIALVRSNYTFDSEIGSLLDYKFLANSYDPVKFVNEETDQVVGFMGVVQMPTGLLI